VRDLEGTAKRKVLLVSEGVRRFLEADAARKIKLVNMGCKLFKKGKESFAGYECLYRLSQEGIHFLLPFMSERKVRVNLQFFKSVLSIHSLIHDDIQDQDIREQIRKMSQGSFCVFIDEIVGGKRVVDALVGQNFKSSFHLMVGKEEIASLNLRYL
jgi:multisite-specific tRNA:(cytosine-C5)-methyltransferase/tRNA (cytosine34-C5)-methyltransferase